MSERISEAFVAIIDWATALGASGDHPIRDRSRGRSTDPGIGARNGRSSNPAILG